MSEKVKLPRKVAEAIESFRETFGSDELYDIRKYVGDELAEERAAEIWYWIKRGNLQTYYKALVNGYEVEETPEEKIEQIYQKYLPAYNGTGALAIVEVLDALRIKIEGVNA